MYAPRKNAARNNELEFKHFAVVMATSAHSNYFPSESQAPVFIAYFVTLCDGGRDRLRTAEARNLDRVRAGTEGRRFCREI